MKLRHATSLTVLATFAIITLLVIISIHGSQRYFTAQSTNDSAVNSSGSYSSDECTSNPIHSDHYCCYVIKETVDSDSNSKRYCKKKMLDKYLPKSEYEYVCSTESITNEYFKNFVECNKKLGHTSECSDGKDNDGDGKTDYNHDAGCNSMQDNSENSDNSSSSNSSTSSSENITSNANENTNTKNQTQNTHTDNTNNAEANKIASNTDNTDGTKKAFQGCYMENGDFTFNPSVCAVDQQRFYKRDEENKRIVSETRPINTFKNTSKKNDKPFVPIVREITKEEEKIIVEALHEKFAKKKVPSEEIIRGRALMQDTKRKLELLQETMYLEDDSKRYIQESIDWIKKVYSMFDGDTAAKHEFKTAMSVVAQIIANTEHIDKKPKVAIEVSDIAKRAGALINRFKKVQSLLEEEGIELDANAVEKIAFAAIVYSRVEKDCTNDAPDCEELIKILNYLDEAKESLRGTYEGLEGDVRVRVDGLIGGEE